MNQKLKKKAKILMYQRKLLTHVIYVEMLVILMLNQVMMKHTQTCMIISHSVKHSSYVDSAKEMMEYFTGKIIYI
mgnify:CR=1 FL=1